MKILSLFSGIGAFEKALENIGADYELVNYCEIDKYASKAFSLIHNLDENLNIGDITKIETETFPNDIDIITYGFPCQDISNAGKQAGFTDENGDLTRSGLFFEALRIIEDTQPKFAIAENVKALTGNKFKAEFKIVLDSLNNAGYKNYWAVLNAKDYGMPQNRERVFIISIRKDIDHGFNFPKPYELKLKLADLLETNVDEKYYLSDEALKNMTLPLENAGKRSIDIIGHSGSGGQKGRIHTVNGIIGALSATDYNQPKEILETVRCEQVADLKYYKNDQMNRVYSPDGISPTLTAVSGGGREAKIAVREAVKKGYTEAAAGDYVNLHFPNSKTRRGRVGKQTAQTLLTNDANGVVVKTTRNADIASTIRATIYKQGSRNLIKNVKDGGGYEGIIEHGERLRIRKLTPKECFRLMGFDDKDVDILIDNGISNTQLYKMAGNSIVVDVLEEIYCNLLNEYRDVV